MPRANADAAVTRWIARPLFEAGFLRLHVAELSVALGPGREWMRFRPDPHARLFEAAFFACPPGPRYLAQHRDEAWATLRDPVLSVGRPWERFRAVLALLRSRSPRAEPGRPGMLEIWGGLGAGAPAPESLLVDGGAADRGEIRLPGGDLRARYEVHAHLYGAVPFEHLWTGWLGNERWARQLEGVPFRSCGWEMNGAEAVALARRVAAELGAPMADGEVESRWCASLVQGLAGGGVGAPPLRGRRDVLAAGYLALRGAVREALVVGPGEVGLDSFRISYDRYADAQFMARDAPGNQDRRLVRAALDRYAREGVQGVELRPALNGRGPAETVVRLRDCVLGYFDHLEAAWKGGGAEGALRFGLVPSLIRQAHLEPGLRTSSLDAWEGQAAAWARQVEHLLVAVGEVPWLRYFLVGLDVAAGERGCPPRAVAPALGRVQAYNRALGLEWAHPGREVRVDLLRRAFGRAGRGTGADLLLEELGRAREIPPARIGLTVHAGEDFLDPVTGLRHVWEAAEVLDLQPGDRIGHGIALGLHPAALRQVLDARCHGPGRDVESLGGDRWRLLKPRGTHLLDLAWEFRIGEPAERRALAEMIGRVAVGSFGYPARVDRLLRDLGAAGPVPHPVLPGIRYRAEADVGPEDREWVVVDRDWLRRFEAARERTIARVERRGLTVESCPTSNCVVSGLDVPPIGELSSHPDLRVALATDDPGLLDAWPGGEASRALVAIRGRVGPEAAWTELERVVGEAERSSFIAP